MVDSSDLPLACQTCSYRVLNDDWCIVFDTDCYKESVLLDEVLNVRMKERKEEENGKDM